MLLTRILAPLSAVYGNHRDRKRMRTRRCPLPQGWHSYPKNYIAPKLTCPPGKVVKALTLCPYGVTYADIGELKKADPADQVAGRVVRFDCELVSHLPPEATSRNC